MAQYDWSSDELVADFEKRADLSAVSKSAISEILESESDESGKNRVFQVEGLDGEIVVVPGDIDIVEVSTALGKPQIQIPAGKPMVVVILGADGVKVVADYDGSAIAVVGGGAGDGDVISFVDSIVSVAAASAAKSVATSTPETTAASSARSGVTVEGLAGDDNIETASGADVIIAGQGNDLISSGAGDDIIYAGLGNDTIDAGPGWDTAIMEAGTYTVELIGAQVVLRNTASGSNTTVENVEYITLDDSNAVVVASGREDATAARQAETILGRQVSSAELKDYNTLVDAIGLDAASTDLQLTSGYTESTSELSDTEFIELHYQAIFGRASDEAGLAFYEEQLSSGFIDRGKLVADLSWSNEGVDSFEFIYTIDHLI